MHNWHSVEAEAEFRRLEWERMASADARAALAATERVWPSWLQLPRLSFSGLKRVQAPRLSFAATGGSSQSADCAC
jgi:hypothetical protein